MAKLLMQPSSTTRRRIVLAGPPARLAEVGLIVGRVCDHVGASSPAEVVEALDLAVDLAILIDPGQAGPDLALFTLIRDRTQLDLPILVIGDLPTVDEAVGWLKRGAADYLPSADLTDEKLARAIDEALASRDRRRPIAQVEVELAVRKDEFDRSLRSLREAQGQLIQSEKLASMGHLVAGVAHEINNPLAYATNNLAVLDRDLRRVVGLMGEYRSHFGDEIPESLRLGEEKLDLAYTLPNLDRLLKSTVKGLQRVGEIVACLRDFSRLDEADHKLIDPNEPIRTVVEMVRFQARQKNVEIDVDAGAIEPCWTNPGKLNQVLLNLTMNAIQAVEEGQKVAIRSRLQGDPPAIIYEVEDWGPGIPDGIRGKIFDPFFTTKPQGVGTGLGLWTTHNLVKDLGGRIDLVTEVGRGTTFGVSIPFLRDHPRRPSAGVKPG